MRDRSLMLLRHAKSSWELGPERDHERGLSERGELAAALIGAYLAQHGEAPDLVLCSTAERARETLARVRSFLAAPPETRFEKALYLAEAESLLARLRRLERRWRSVLVVGHNPGLQGLAGRLAHEADRAAGERIAGKFPTAALASFRLRLERWRDLGPGAVATVAVIAPKDLV
jgi:phosphohistidine phosphatase